MNKFYFALLGLFLCAKAQAQLPNTTCANAIQICFENPIGYPATVGAGPAETGPEYGCLNSRPNPAWFYFQVGTPGDHQLFITNSQNRDLDFILYGPFAFDDPWCDSLTALNTADCSYAGGTTETANFTSTVSGDVYVLLITNFSNQPTNVTIVQNAGNGTFTCDFVAPCLVSQILATPGTCDTLTNQYALSGQVWSFNTPATGTLTVTCSGQTQTLNAPFSNPTTFAFSGLTSNGQSNTISASFSATSTCVGTVTYTAPAGCIPCEASVSSNSPVCAGDSVQITTSFSSNATFQWVGPNFFTSAVQNPTFIANSDSASGVYTVLITGENCVSERSVLIDVTQSPAAQAIPLDTELCEGEILFLSAVNYPGASFQWSGPNGFQASTRNTQVNNTDEASSGNYIVSMSVNGCQGTSDTVQAQINPSPIINLTIPEFSNPLDGPGVFYITGLANYSYQWNFIGNTTLIATQSFSALSDTAYISWTGGEGLVGAQVIATDNIGCVSDPVQALTQVIIPLNTKEIASADPQIFPNPAKDIAYFKNFPEGDFSVYDLSGKLVNKGQITGNVFAMAQNGLLPGIYTVEILKENIPFRYKLVWQ
jgi:hypothetical protein